MQRGRADVQLLPRPGHGDVSEPPFLFQQRLRVGAAAFGRLAVLQTAGVQRGAVRENALGSAEEHDDRELQPLRLVNRHQGDPVACFARVPAGLLVMRIPRRHIVDEIEKRLELAEPSCRQLQLVQHFLQRLPVKRRLMAFIRQDEGIIEGSPKLPDGLNRGQRPDTPDHREPVRDGLLAEVRQARQV
ncbi:hypothetical protein D3C71_1385250 [compost metagenome]